MENIPVHGKVRAGRLQRSKKLREQRKRRKFRKLKENISRDNINVENVIDVEHMEVDDVVESEISRERNLENGSVEVPMECEEQSIESGQRQNSTTILSTSLATASTQCVLQANVEFRPCRLIEQDISFGSSFGIELSSNEHKAYFITHCDLTEN